MADDRNVRGAVDRSRINMQVTREQLAEAVRAVGVMVKNVAAKLGKAR